MAKKRLVVNQDDGDIVKSNALIESMYLQKPISVLEMRLFHACLAQIRSRDTLSHEQVFYVSVDALAQIAGVRADSMYGRLRAAADRLTDTSITVHENPDGSLRPEKERKIKLFAECAYVPNEGRVEMHLSHRIIPFIAALRGRFTRLQAFCTIRFNSLYSFRIYELCMQWSAKATERQFEVQELRRLLGVETKYLKMERFRSEVLIPSLKQINRFSDLRLSYTQKKEGRRITHITLSFEVLSKEALNARLDMYEKDLRIPVVLSSPARKRARTRIPKSASRNTP